MHPDGTRQALWLSYFALAWTAVSGIVTVAEGLASSSTALVGTGADVLADMASSAVLIWRFRSELAGHPSSARFERIAERAAAIALLIVAAGITATAISRLLAGGTGSPSSFAIVTAAASVVVLPVFVALKYQVASRVPSPALRMDGHISLVGAVMAAITLVGLAVTAELGWRQADPIAGILVSLAAAIVAMLTLFSARTDYPS